MVIFLWYMHIVRRVIKKIGLFTKNHNVFRLGDFLSIDMCGLYVHQLIRI